MAAAEFVDGPPCQVGNLHEVHHLRYALPVCRLETSDEALALEEAREHHFGHCERKLAVDAPILGQIA